MARRAVVALVLVLTACSSSSDRVLPTPPTTVATSTCRPSPGAGTSTLVTLQMVGGLPGGLPQAVAGTVTVIASSGEQCTASVGGSGHVSLMLAPGTYQLTGRSPQYNDGSLPCAAEKPFVAPHVVEGSEVPPPQFVNVDCPRR
ncbi:MAG: hypothetical protein M3Q30_26545 [Actinomycetota bacterium]|nr:hypothetical protein [Actinomycetota bacterium]